jgi:hypothetical protein
MRWFGASVFGFMLATFFGYLLTQIWPPADALPAWPPADLLPGMVSIHPLEPRLWLTSAVWGGCMGWAMARMPEITGASAEG